MILFRNKQKIIETKVAKKQQCQNACTPCNRIVKYLFVFVLDTCM